jgi:GTP-binding protein
LISLPIVSIVGRPNVGKSSLFNRIAGKRIAVVDDFPGVTRDRNYCQANWNGLDFTLVDTGGLIPSSQEAIPEAIEEQVNIAISESDVVLFLVDADSGMTDYDLIIAKQIRKAAQKKIIAVVNKAESKKVAYEIEGYKALGLGKPMPVSAIHGIGVADLLDEIVEMIRTHRQEILRADEITDNRLKIAIVGRPNAGKSSLVNKLLRQNRMIVDSEPGTTRDSIDTEMNYHGSKVVLIDTAGLRKRSHVKEDMEYFSNLRALQSIERCDICVLVIDVTSAIGVQDLRILRKVLELRKGIILAWNKWDIQEKDHRTFDQLVAETRRQYMELRPVPMVSISALTGQRVTNVIDLAIEVKGRLQNHVPSSEFENKVFEWVRVHPHPAIPENPVRFLGARQISVPFPLFRFFVTNPDEIAPSYVRYLTNKIYENYDFDGCPVVLEFRPIKKPKHGSYEQQGNYEEEQM